MSKKKRKGKRKERKTDIPQEVIDEFNDRPVECPRCGRFLPGYILFDVVLNLRGERKGGYFWVVGCNEECGFSGHGNTVAVTHDVPPQNMMSLKGNWGPVKEHQ